MSTKYCREKDGKINENERIQDDFAENGQKRT
jgi:hypothetical protein